MRSSWSQSLPDDQALHNLGQLLDLPIDLRRADADAARVQRRVRAAVDDRCRRAPCVRHSRRGVHTPESARSRRRGISVRPDRSRTRPASTGTVSCRPARPFVPRTERPASSKTSTFMPSPGDLDLATPDGRGRIAADEAADDVRASGHEARWTSRLHRAIDEFEALGHQRRPGGESSSALRRDCVSRRGRRPAFATASMNFARRAEERDPGSRRQNRTARCRRDETAIRRTAAASHRRPVPTRASSTSSSRTS